MSLDFETSEVIQKANFIDTADQLLVKANDPHTDIEASLEAAKKIADTLDAVEADKLEVQPPLSSEEIAGYRGQINTILEIGKKAADALESTDRAGIGSRIMTAFFGEGKAAKTR